MRKACAFYRPKTKGKRSLVEKARRRCESGVTSRQGIGVVSSAPAASVGGDIAKEHLRRKKIMRKRVERGCPAGNKVRRPPEKRSPYEKSRGEKRGSKRLFSSPERDATGSAGEKIVTKAVRKNGGGNEGEGKKKGSYVGEPNPVSRRKT